MKNLDNLKLSQGSYHYSHAINQPGLLAEDIVFYFLEKGGYPVLGNTCYLNGHSPSNGQVLTYNEITKRIEFKSPSNINYEGLITLINGKQDKFQFQKNGTNLGVAGEIKKLNFTGNGFEVDRIGDTVNVTIENTSGAGISLNDVQSSFKYIQLIPISLNAIPNLPDLPINANEVVISVNGVRVDPGITVNQAGIFSVFPNLLGYNIDTGDVITCIYFS